MQGVLKETHESVIDSSDEFVVLNRIEIRPDTKRTTELVQQEKHLLEIARQKAEQLKRDSEMLEAQKRMQEQEERRLRAQREQSEKEAEARKVEEDRQRGRRDVVNTLISNSTASTTPSFISLDTINLSPVQTRLLSQTIACSRACKGIILNDKRLAAEDSIILCKAIGLAQFLVHVSLERICLGPAGLVVFAEAIRKNNFLQYVSLEGNDITSSDTDVQGISVFMESVGQSLFLKTVNISSCYLKERVVPCVLGGVDTSRSIVWFDLSNNYIPLITLHRMSILLCRNADICKDLAKAAYREDAMLRNAETYDRMCLVKVEQRRREIERNEKEKRALFWRKVEMYRERQVQQENAMKETMETLKVQFDGYEAKSKVAKPKLRKKK